MAKGLCYKPRGSIGHKPESEAPAGLDYDLWTGPAEMKPFNPNKLHYNWHWIWNTGNGDLGNQGIHQMDLARWGLGKNEFPKTVMSAGGRYGYKDDGETPNTQTVDFEFDDALLQFEVRGLATNDELGVKIGDLFYGTEGVLAITSYYRLADLLGPEARERASAARGAGDHFANFLQAVRSRDVKSLNGDIEEGHLSSAYCHLGNIAYKLGRKLHINPSTETFVDDAQADALLTRKYRTGIRGPGGGLKPEGPELLGRPVEEFRAGQTDAASPDRDDSDRIAHINRYDKSPAPPCRVVFGGIADPSSIDTKRLKFVGIRIPLTPRQIGVTLIA